MNLRPAILDEVGLVATLSWFSREFERVYPITVLNQTEVTEDDVPEPLKIVIFRIVQEALNNSAKHSRADRINLKLIKENGTIQLAIEDNGQGFDPDEVGARMGAEKGLGLISMKERVENSAEPSAFDQPSKAGRDQRHLACFLVDGLPDLLERRFHHSLLLIFSIRFPVGPVPAKPAGKGLKDQDGLRSPRRR